MLLGIGSLVGFGFAGVLHDEHTCASLMHAYSIRTPTAYLYGPQVAAAPSHRFGCRVDPDVPVARLDRADVVARPL